MLDHNDSISSNHKTVLTKLWDKMDPIINGSSAN